MSDEESNAQFLILLVLTTSNFVVTIKVFDLSSLLQALLLSYYFR
jgi:hypothetical protein